MGAPGGQPPGATRAHHSLDAFGVILEALRLGDAIARELPRGYGKLSATAQAAARASGK